MTNIGQVAVLCLGIYCLYGTSERRLITVREQSVIVVWSPIRAFIISVLPKRRNLPKLRRKDHGRDGRMKREGKRPDHAPEYE